jgi:uroporphyrinogen III methyltransferase/synthase
MLIAIGPQTAKALGAKELECYICKKHSEEGFLSEIIEMKEKNNA